MEHRDPQEAFERAIKAERLSLDTEADNYAGNYMYMHTEGGRDNHRAMMLFLRGKEE